MYLFKEAKLPLPPPQAIGSLQIQRSINVFTEFCPVKSTMVGYMDSSAQIPEGLQFDNPYVTQTIKYGPYDPSIIQTCQEVHNKVAEKFLSMGIEVVRPGRIDHSRKKKFGDTEASGFHNFSARDHLFFYHDTVYYSPSFEYSPQIDMEAYNWISEQLRWKGSKWINSWTGEIKEDTPLWDAANLLRVGLDIIFLISASANELGYSNFRKFLEERYNGRVRVHPFRNPESSVHIDTTINIIGWNSKLQKYLITADKTVTNPTRIPAIFRGKNWVVLEIHNKYLIDFGVVEGYHMSSFKMGENFFMINQKLAVVDEKQTKMIKLLEFYGIECIPMSNPYGREVGGGFHCMTNDWNREEEKDFKKVLDNPLSNENITEDDLAGYFDPKLLKFLQEKGDLDEWTNICNKEGIFPTYVTDHLSEEEVQEMKQRHEEDKKRF